MSKRRRAGITGVLILLAAVFVWFDRNLDGRLWRHVRPTSAEQTRTWDCEKYHAKTFTVVNVVDGDTIDIDIPDGKPVLSRVERYDHTRIRLWGIDTPETKSEKYGVMYFGPEASTFATKLALGKPVTVYLDEENRTRDKYGRLLAYVKLPDGTFLNEVLISEGFAYADLRFKHSLYNKYKQLESSARSLKKGLWRNVTPDQLPEWLQRENPNLLKK